MKQILTITRKEFLSYVSSPMALIFVGAFLAATLFSFFWVDTFFARGIADVRPLFNWMPLLLIFLVAALTMRQWSEEQRSGTLEILLTLPVSYTQLVLGKFLAVLALVAISLGLTLFLPITVEILGNLDWGPVAGGYLAALLLSGAYAAIGLFVSSRTDNQIVSLISTVLLCGVFYILGSGGITEFVADTPAAILKAIGTGSRFESIERGVIDLRDLVYYLSLSALFLALNVTSLDILRWSRGPHTLPHRRGVTITTALLALNLIAMNVWLYPLHGLRLDLTEQKEYSLSDTTRQILDGLQEPLVVRGYFSARTHPLLAPLVPTIQDMLREYEIAASGMLELDFIDPMEDPEKEAEANQVYGIQPTPFQVAGRYEASVINSYFDILIRYGDQSVVLGYGDLIEVEQGRDQSLDVRLRNLEYDLTRSIKKVVYGFQSVAAVLAAMDEPANLTLYITPETLPDDLLDAQDTIVGVVNDIRAESAGKFTYEIVNPDAPGSPVTRQELNDAYGIQPIALSLFSDQSYYLYMVLQIGEQTEVLYPSGEVSEADVRTNIEAALKRASSGFLKVVGLWKPPEIPTQDIFGQMQDPLSTWQVVESQLREYFEVRIIDLSSGEVPVDVDVLVLVGPQGFSDVERFAVDQYLMRGGSVVVAAGNYGITADPFSGTLALQELDGTLQEMLESYGIRVEKSLVMDPINESFPVPVTRQVGTFEVQEIQLIDYPFFVDVRADQMDKGSPITANLPAVTLNWVSPLTVDEAKNADREVVTLLTSSRSSWLKMDTDIHPNFNLYPELGFPPGEEQVSYPLAVAVQGAFESSFKDVASPLDSAEETQIALPTIESSPETARLVVIGSAEFLDDFVFRLSSNLGGDRYLNSLQFMQNAVDWSVEDLDLLNIRTRGTYARVLNPMTENEQTMWEGLNYAVALLALIGFAVNRNIQRRNERPLQLVEVENPSPNAGPDERE